jgi:hypothetical protein
MATPATPTVSDGTDTVTSDVDALVSTLVARKCRVRESLHLLYAGTPHFMSDVIAALRQHDRARNFIWIRVRAFVIEAKLLREQVLQAIIDQCIPNPPYSPSKDWGEENDQDLLITILWLKCEGKLTDTTSLVFDSAAIAIMQKLVRLEQELLFDLFWLIEVAHLDDATILDHSMFSLCYCYQVLSAFLDWHDYDKGCMHPQTPPSLRFLGQKAMQHINEPTEIPAEEVRRSVRLITGGDKPNTLPGFNAETRPSRWWLYVVAATQ